MKINAVQTEKAIFFSRLLSRLYQEPLDAPILEELVRLDLTAAWPFILNSGTKRSFDVFKKTLESKDMEITRQELRDEHMLLFIGIGMPLVPLWGSVYLDEENLLMGKSTYELETFLSRAGLGITIKRREPLDHLSLALSAVSIFLVRLTEQSKNGGDAEPELRELLETHLSPWVPRCLELLAEQAQTPFYRAIGELTATMLSGLSEACGAERVKQTLYY